MMLALMPMRLHRFFGVPVALTLEMTADQGNLILNDGHRVTIAIAGHNLELTAYKSWPVVKVHLMRLTLPIDRDGGSI